MISVNLRILRKANKFTQEEVAEKINVSRQAVAKWEKGDSLPDINNCMSLAELYGITIDNLVKEIEDYNIPIIPPKGKHIFGTATMGERGQIVIPKKARDLFGIKPGDSMVILGDEAQGGIAIMKSETFMLNLELLMDTVHPTVKSDLDK